jgi:hypothetical protein
MPTLRPGGYPRLQSVSMADTSYLKRVVEPRIRTILEDRYGQPFYKRFLPLRSGGRHEFDAVSADGEIVVSIKSSSGLTSGGNAPDGKIKNSLAELYYLSLVDAPTRILVLTNPDFHRIFTKKAEGAIAPGLSVELIGLPADEQAEVDAVVAAASAEVTPEAARPIIAVELEEVPSQSVE